MSQQGINTNTASGVGTPKARPRASRLWACATVLIVLILVAGLPIGYMIVRWTHSASDIPRAMKDFAADAVRPKIIVHDVIVSTVESVKRERKLVVLTPVVTADVTRKEGNSSWGIYWGTNTARVLVKDAKAQYYIDLTTVGTADFSVDEPRKLVTVTVPRPKLDPDMVSIDPSKIETLDLSSGWMRWNKQETWERAVAELVPRVLAEADKPLVKDEADRAGKEAVAVFLQPMADTLAKNGMTMEVKYRD